METKNKQSTTENLNVVPVYVQANIRTAGQLAATGRKTNCCLKLSSVIPSEYDMMYKNMHIKMTH